MKKVAIIGVRGYPYVYGGYETLVKEVGERLSIKHFSITVYCHKNLYTNYPEKVNNINLIYIPSIESKILSTFIHSFFSTIHACIFGKFDFILYVNTANGPFGLITKIFNKKTAINTDGLEWKRPKWKGLGATYFYYSSYLSTLVFDKLIADSIEMEKVYKKLFNSKSTYIPYGANIRKSLDPNIIKKFSLSKNNYYLIVGRLIPDNNSDFILNEFINSKSSKKIVIVGDVKYNDKFAMQMKSRSSENVIFTGYIENQDLLAELYHNCYAYLHGHEYGGTNPALLKALAYGSAIFALDTVFSREVLSNQEYGVIFNKEENHLASLIKKH